MARTLPRRRAPGNRQADAFLGAGAAPRDRFLRAQVGGALGDVFPL